MDKENTYSLVWVEWFDARVGNEDWRYLDDFKHDGLCLIHTVGYIIPSSNKAYITIAQNISVKEDKKNMQISGVFYIPTIAIRKKHFIKIPN